ncbi:hypothetical protein ACFQE2_00905 [Methylophaga thalassica]|uniref:hypothetical protein n=1 Tax=Methylophaga thalassica TaxID=40223 RepID=UPI00360DE536
MLLKRPLSLLVILTFLLLSLPLVADLNISSRVLDKIEAQYNKFARKRVEDWQKLVAENKDLPEAEKLELVNQFFNTNVLFIDDIDLWNKKDYWATPLEMLSIGGVTVKTIRSRNISRLKN